MGCIQVGFGIMASITAFFVLITIFTISLFGVTSFWRSNWKASLILILTHFFCLLLIISLSQVCLSSGVFRYLLMGIPVYYGILWIIVFSFSCYGFLCPFLHCIGV